MKESLETKLYDLVNNAEERGKGLMSDVKDNVVNDVMRERGFTDSQILLITIALSMAFASFVTCILLGCSLFMEAGNIIPAVVSSGMVIASTVGAMQKGKLPQTQRNSNSVLGRALDKHIAKAKKVSDKMHEADTALEK